MKALKCELCGSNDVVKQDGLFVCQHCGTKYSTEEAKKLMLDGTVNVQGTVRIDDTYELKNLYENARWAKSTNDCESAKKYYGKIVEKDPNSWEAQFYSLYFKVKTCRDNERIAFVEVIRNCLMPVMELVRDNVPKEQQIEVGDELLNRFYEITDLSFNAAIWQYDRINNYNKTKYVEECCGNAESIIRLMYDFGDILEMVFGDTFSELVVKSWKYGLDLYENYIELWGGKYSREDSYHCYKEYASKIKKYEPDFNLPDADLKTSSHGCYVATAVYGSYNCPEVWTLRRFRDNTLDATWYGRAFIQIYYAISPTLVKWFGKTSWFKKLWRRPLDKMVNALKCKGVEDTPYKDKY